MLLFQVSTNQLDLDKISKTYDMLILYNYPQYFLIAFTILEKNI